MIYFNKSLETYILNWKKVLFVTSGSSQDLFALLPVLYTLDSMDIKYEVVCLSGNDITQLKTKDDVTFLTDNCFGVNYQTKMPLSVEKVFCDFMAEKLNNIQMLWILNKSQTVLQLKESYEKITNLLEIDAIVSCSIGQKTIMFGNEKKQGDNVFSIINNGAISLLETDSILFNLGFETGSKKPVSFNAFMTNLARLNSKGAFLGSCSVLPSMYSFAILKSFYEEYSSHQLEAFCNVEKVLLSEGQTQIAQHDIDNGIIFPIQSSYYIFDLKDVMQENIVLPSIVDIPDYSEMVQNLMSMISKAPNLNPNKEFVLDI